MTRRKIPKKQTAANSQTSLKQERFKTNYQNSSGSIEAMEFCPIKDSGRCAKKRTNIYMYRMSKKLRYD